MCTNQPTATTISPLKPIVRSPHLGQRWYSHHTNKTGEGTNPAEYPPAKMCKKEHRKRSASGTGGSSKCLHVQPHQRVFTYVVHIVRPKPPNTQHAVCGDRVLLIGNHKVPTRTFCQPPLGWQTDPRREHHHGSAACATPCQVEQSSTGGAWRTLYQSSNNTTKGNRVRSR